MRPTTIQGTATIQTTVTLRTALVTRGLYVVRYELASVTMTESAKIAVPHRLRPNSTASFFVDTAGLKVLKAGGQPRNLAYFAVKPEAVEAMRTIGWESVRSWKDKGWQHDDPFAALVDEGATVDNVIRLDVSNNAVFAADGQPLPVAMPFDYINAGIEETRYDLTIAAKLLLSRSDVRIFKVDWRGHAEKQAIAKTVDEAVVRIPHYNANRGRSHTINFVWMPSVDDYRKMIAHAKASKQTPYVYGSGLYQSVFELDLLGLRAGGAAHFDQFFKARETSDADEDEE